MRLLLGTLFALGVAALVGLGATWLALTQGQAFGGLSVGAWTAWPRHGTASIDPYARAMVARSGQLPVGSGDGLAFQARSDDQGNALDGRCDIVRLRHDAAGALLDDHALRSGGRAWCATRVQRHGFTSHEVVRRANGSFEITVVAALASGQLAADRRRRALRAGAAALRYADRRRHPRPRGDDADDRAEALPVIRIALWLLGGVLLGGIVHLTTVLWLPELATQDAYSRLAPVRAGQCGERRWRRRRRTSRWCRSSIRRSRWRCAATTSPAGR